MQKEINYSNFYLQFISPYNKEKYIDIIIGDVHSLSINSQKVELDAPQFLLIQGVIRKVSTTHLYNKQHKSKRLCLRAAVAADTP